MKHKFLFCFCIFYSYATIILSQGTWVQKSSIPASVRMAGVAFAIDSKGYLGLGHSDMNTYLNDFWEYDPLNNSWTQKANFSGGVRTFAVGFAIGKKGYVGTGLAVNGPFGARDDFYEYDPALNSWTNKTSFPGGPRTVSFSFSINGFGYIGSGIATSPAITYNDLWKFDPVLDAWTQMGNLPIAPRKDMDRAVFVIGNKVYCGTGVDVGYNFHNDIWEYDPFVDSWTQKASLPAPGRQGAVGFSICRLGFLGLGGNPFAIEDFCFWMYDPLTNIWSAASQFPVSGGRVDAQSFVIGNLAYVGTGASTQQVHNDLWEFGYAPSIYVTGNTSICQGQSTTLVALGGNAYSWNTNATTSSIVVSPSATTTYFVFDTTMTCPGPTYITINAFIQPVASITGATTICSGQTETLTASIGENYIWNTGQTTSSILISPSASTNYSVIVSNGTCSDVASLNVVVNATPSISITGNTSLCSGDITTLTAFGGGYYTWNTGATTSSIVVNPSSITSYSIVTSNASGCSNTKSITVLVTPKPTITITNNTSICSGHNTTLIASGGGNYQWNTGQTNASIIISPTTHSTYSVIISIGSCTETASSNITVLTSPNPSISGNISLCSGNTATLTASGGNYYSWNTGETTSAILITPFTTTNYTATAINTNGCTNSASASVIVSPSPTITITGNTTICSDQSIALNASGIGNYLWSNGATTTSIIPTASGTYSVVVTFGNCSDTASTTLIINPSITANISGDINIFQGQNTTLSASGGVTYLWNTGITDSVIIVNPIIDTTYCVTVFDLNNCMDTTCIMISVESPCDTAGAFFFPNAFSPNGDGENDFLKVYYNNLNCISTLHLAVYDHWGEKVFETSDLNFAWDGKTKKSELNSQVLAYYLHILFTDKTRLDKKGNISLVR